MFEKQTPGYLNLCIRSGDQLITSGHVSTLKGKLGAGLTTEEGYEAALRIGDVDDPIPGLLEIKDRYEMPLKEMFAC